MRLKETHCRSFLRFVVNLDNEIRLKKLAQSSFLRLLGNYAIWLRGQAVKTPPFHGGNTGSSPVGVILKVIHLDL